MNGHDKRASVYMDYLIFQESKNPLEYREGTWVSEIGELIVEAIEIKKSRGFLRGVPWNVLGGESVN